MRTRAQDLEPGSPLSDGQALLFDVPPPRTAVSRRLPKDTTCTECGRPLRSERSIRAGVGTECAAKTGRAVLSSRKPTKNRAAPAN